MRNQIFKSEEFGSIRTICDEQGEVLFCAKDVCDALKYRNNREALRKHVEEKDVTKRDTLTSGGSQSLLYVNESGLYSLILGSKLESARRFKHWVTSEVLPAIRKDGGYLVAREGESNEVIMARAMKVLENVLKERDKQIALLKPKADYADEVLESKSCFTITQIAKELNMTGNELNRLLCRLRVQYCQSGQYLPYAEYARLGYTRNRTYWEECSKGRLFTSTYLVWTERGRQFIHRLVKSVA